MEQGFNKEIPFTLSSRNPGRDFDIVSLGVNSEYGFSKEIYLDKNLIDSNSPRFPLDSLLAKKGFTINPNVLNPPVSDVEILKEIGYD